jgi:hypothetical protein
MPGYHDSLSESVLVTLDIAAQTASANVNGTAMDMSGWDGCLYIFNIGAMAASATFDARIVQSANSNMSGATNITNAAITQLASTSNTNSVHIDVWRPTNRYIRSATIPATANTTFSSMAVRYRASGILPVTQTAVQLVKVQVN